MKWSRKPAATRQAWLDELGRRLVWFFPADQVKDIVSDYREQFETGHDHGRTEPEIIQGLGTPAEAAALLLEEEPSAKLNCLRHGVTWGAALAVCCASIWAFLNSVGTLVTLPLTASVLFLLLRGPARVELEAQAEKNISPILCYCVPFILMLLFEAVEQIMVALGERLPASIAGMSIGEANTWAILYLEAIIAALAVWLLYRSVTASVRYFPGVIHTAGTGASIFLTYACFTSLHVDAIFSLPLDMLLCLLPYGVGLVTALAFQRWTDGRRPLPRFFRDREASWQDWRHCRAGCCWGCCGASSSADGASGGSTTSSPFRSVCSPLLWGQSPCFSCCTSGSGRRWSDASPLRGSPASCSSCCRWRLPRWWKASPSGASTTRSITSSRSSGESR